MSDRDWRAWERRLQTQADDQDALHGAIAARQRAGLPVPGWMHARRLFGPRRFDSALVIFSPMYSMIGVS